METEMETRIYEIGYLLKGDLSEEEALEMSEAVRKAIEDEKGLITQENKPGKKNLEYPIKKHDTAYFGSLKFIFPAEKLERLKKSLGKIDLLRFSLNQSKREEEATKHPVRRRPIRRPISRPAAGIDAIIEKEFPVTTEEGAVKEPLRVEEIDKKLEEILGE